MYYHVRITPKSNPSQTEVELDISLEDLKDRFVLPYNQGRSIVISGKTLPSGDIDRIQINATEQDSTSLNSIIKQQQRDRRIVRRVDHRDRLPLQLLADHGEDVTSKYIAGPPGYEAEASTQPIQELMPPTSAREVFVVHGRNLAARDALFEFLRALDLHPLEWAEAVSATGKPSPYIGEILDAVFSRAHAVVVLFTPDDEARLKRELRRDSDPTYETELTGQARPNVLFEAGMAMSRSQYRTVLVELGDLRPFSDLGGRHTIRLDDSSQRRQDLAQRLEAAGCPVNSTGTDWHTAGDFDNALTSFAVDVSELQNVVDQRATNSRSLGLSEDAKELLTEATKDADGEILKLKTMGGQCFRTNGKHFGEMGDRRSEAKWEGVLNDLLITGLLVEDEAHRDKLFKVTREGFEAIDTLESL